MAITHGTTARNNMADGVDNAVNAGAGTAQFVWLDGTKTVVSFALNTTAAFNAATAGSITLQDTTLTATASTAGTVDSFEVRSKNGTAQILGSIGTSGTDFTVDNTSVSSGQTCKITSFVWNSPS